MIINTGTDLASDSGREGNDDITRVLRGRETHGRTTMTRTININTVYYVDDPFSCYSGRCIGQGEVSYRPVLQYVQ